MPVRIYALAKELDIDSKVLVDLCTKAGVTGKGSALASLTDEEATTVRAFVAGGSKPAPPKPVPPKPVAPKPIVTIPSGSSSSSSSASASTASSSTASSSTAPSSSAAASATLTQPPLFVPAAPVPSMPAAPVEQAAFRREDYVGTTGSPVRPPTIGARSDRKPPLDVRKRPASEGGGRPQQRSGPSIRVAPLPNSVQPQPAQGPAEPAPQKPDIKLPIDAIRAGKAGTKPLQEHLRKQEAKRRSDTPAPAPARGRAGPGGRPAMPPVVPPDALPGAAGRDRNRKKAAPRTGAAPEGGGEFPSSLGGREHRQLARKRAGTGRRGDDEGGSRRSRLRIRRTGANTAAPRKGKVVVELPATVRSLSEAIGIPAQKVLMKLLAMGTPTTINATLDDEVVELLAVELGAEIEIKQAEDAEEELLRTWEEQDDDPEAMVLRPPVVTFLGHVDHGKTSLLDRIIGTNLVSGESGGITQHIRAYKIEKDGREIAFVDTPGHEAFTEMRARGANVTDIAVLVVAANDGVKPQTEEAISHARAAGVPIVVALNKIDLPGIDQERVLQQLATNELLPTAWGGETEVIPVSALTGAGMDELLETLLTIAELHEYKANPSRAAYGTCLEAELHEGRGVVAKLLVQNGTLKLGDIIVCGGAYGRVKAMYDTLRPTEAHDEAGPSTPVNVTGLDQAPGAGDRFYVMSDISEAREIAEKRLTQARQVSLGGQQAHVTLETLFDRLGSDQVQTLNLILRADVRGSIEAIQKELTKLQHAEVQIKILQATVGGISEADVHLADASDAIIIGFNVVPDEGARALAEQRGVQIRRYDIIYQVTDDLRLALEGMLKPERREVELGRTLVQRTYTISRIGTIAGCRVLAGTVERNCRMRVIRDNRVIGEYGLDSLKREKDDAREVREGMECGIKLAGFNDVKEGDVLEAYRVEEGARTL